tara:strand:- start:205 stop:354 length:150 start_codon:yes stop_codon:yes gene_type:complete
MDDLKRTVALHVMPELRELKRRQSIITIWQIVLSLIQLVVIISLVVINA